ncbi:MAG: PspA/IM30 family protein [Acidobacteriota bacterium]|nr:PspA/IM30 family protein [Acidobacteriota bacterium]
MGIFSRITEIVNANINSMLDKAEDPEKMVKLMIHEMEDTLTEVKSAAAEVVADKIRLNRVQQAEAKRRDEWEAKAQLALEKGREDLAREALEQKMDAHQKLVRLDERLAEVEGLVAQYQDDITRLEEKLGGARERQRSLIANHQSAMNRRRVEEKIYRINTTGAFAKFENYENRIDRWQAEAEVYRRSNTTLDQKFNDLVHGNKVDEELARLKKKLAGAKPSAKAKGKNEETAAAN